MENLHCIALEMDKKGHKVDWIDHYWVDQVDQVDQVGRYWETNGRKRGQLVAALPMPAKQVEVENFTLGTDFTSDSTKNSLQSSTTLCAVGHCTYSRCPPPKGYNSSSVGHSGRARERETQELQSLSVAAVTPRLQSFHRSVTVTL